MTVLACQKALTGAAVILWDYTSFRPLVSSWMVSYWLKATGVRAFWLAFGDRKTCLTADGGTSIE